MNVCTICKKPIVLQPTAAERAAKDCTGKNAANYTSIFTEHSACTLRKRAEDISQVMKEYRESKPNVPSYPKS